MANKYHKKEKKGQSPIVLTENQIKFNDQFKRAKDHRTSSCFWFRGGDWNELWDLQDNFAIMSWGDMADDVDTYSSKVRSPEIAGRLMSTMQKLSKLNYEFVSRPKRQEAKFAASISQIIVNNQFSKNNMRFRLNDAYYDALRHGTALATVEFVHRERKVSIPINKEEFMTKEEKKAFTEKGEIPYRKYTKVDLHDVVIKNRRIQEIYIDPNARNVREESYYAGYYFEEFVMTKDRFDKIYSSKQGYKNLDKVLSVGQITDLGNSEAWFEPPKDISGDFVYLVAKWDYDNDLYMLRANDQFIKESPLPYIDKELPLVVLTPFKLPEQFYGIGLVDFLIPITVMLELLQNAIYDYMMMTTNPIMLVEKSGYNEFSRYYKKAVPGLMIPAKDITRAVAPLKYMPLSMDVFQAVSSLQRDAVIASQHDPTQLGLVSKKVTATANIMNKEVLDAYVNYVMVNFSEGLNEMAKMVESRARQFLTDKDVYEILNGKMEVETISREREIKVDNMELDIDWDNKTIKMIDKPGTSTYVPIRGDAFEYKDKDGNLQRITSDDIDIELTAESRELLSEALEIQKAKENLGQLSFYMVDPNDKEKAMRHPAPWINGPSFLEEYFEVNKIDKKHLINRTENDREDMDLAMEQNREMFQGIRPIPEAGMSQVHLRIHEDFLGTVKQMLQKQEQDMVAVQEDLLKRAIGQLPPENQQAMAMGMMPQAPLPPAPGDLQAKVDKLKEIVAIIEEHLHFDSEPAYGRTDAAIEQGKTPAAPAQAPAGGEQMNPMGSGAQMGGEAQMMGAMMGQTGGPGQIGGVAGQF